MGNAQQPKKRCSHGSAYHTSASIQIAIWSGGTGLHFEEIRLSRYGPEIHRPGTPQILRSCCRRRMGELSGKRGTIGWSIRYRPFRPLDPFEKKAKELPYFISKEVFHRLISKCNRK